MFSHVKPESCIILDKLFLCERKSSDSLYPQITLLLHTVMYTGFYQLDLGMKCRQPSPETAAVAAFLSLLTLLLWLGSLHPCIRCRHWEGCKALTLGAVEVREPETGQELGKDGV